jgi:hypothetical protein
VDAGREGEGLMDRARVLQREEDERRRVKRRVAKWVVVTFAMFSGDIGGRHKA